MPKLADYLVKTKYVAVDKMSAAYKAMGGKAKAFGNKTSAAFNKASRSATTFRGVLAAIGVAAALRRVMMGATAAIRTLGEEYLEFDKNLTKAVTRLPGGLGRGSEAFKTFGKIARREAERTEFTAGQTAGAVEQLALAGFNLKQSAAALPGTINLATNASVEVAEATKIASKTLGAFGLKVTNTAQLTKNLTRVNDVFSQTISSATLDIEGLFETLKFGGPAAHAAGQSIETFSAITGTLADQSIDASVAGTSLRRAFLNLALPKTAKHMKKLGVKVADSAGNFRDFLDIMGDIEVATAKMGNKQKLATLATIFGARAVNAMNAILVKGVDNVKDFRTELENSAGASVRMADTIRKSLTNRMLRLKSALIEVGFKFVEAFGGKSGRTLEELIKAVRKFDVQPVVKAIKDVIQAVKDIKAGVELLWPAIRIAAGAWIAYKLGIKGIAAIQWGLNAAMAANPIGLIAVALIIVVAYLAIVSKHWDAMSAGLDVAGNTWAIAVEKMIMWVKDLAATIINGPIKAINILIGLINKVAGKQVIKPVEMLIDKGKFLQGSKETIDQLTRDQKSSARNFMGEMIRSNSGIMTEQNRRLKDQLTAGYRAAYRGVTPGVLNVMAQQTGIKPEFELPMSGGQILPEDIQAPAQQRGSAHTLTIEGAPKGSSLKQTKGAPGLDVRLLGEAS